MEPCASSLNKIVNSLMLSVKVAKEVAYNRGNNSNDMLGVEGFLLSNLLTDLRNACWLLELANAIRFSRRSKSDAEDNVEVVEVAVVEVAVVEVAVVEVEVVDVLLIVLTNNRKHSSCDRPRAALGRRVE